MKKIIIYFIFLFVIHNKCLSVDTNYAFNVCNRYHKANDYENASEWCSKAAIAGHPEAQYRQGMFYYEGKGVTQSFSMAVMWFEKAAEQKFSLAQYKISEIYRQGKGVKVDLQKSIFWLTEAAENNLHGAIKELADIYYKGDIIERDFKKSAEWYMKLAEKGDPYAQYQLGWMYDNAEGFEDDDITAFSWFMKAAEQGHSKAQTQIAWMYERAEGVEQNYNEAFKWYTKSAENGYSSGQLHLGRIYSEGKGTKQDYQKAFHWYMKSATQGNPSAQNEVGLMYLEGLGVEKDIYKAYEWVHKASLSKNDVFMQNEKQIRLSIQSIEVSKANELIKLGKYRDAYELAKNSKFKVPELEKVENVAKQHLNENVTLSEKATQEWYIGGTLHSAKGKDWRVATNSNRLATSADFIVKMSANGDLTFTIQGTDSLKPYAIELSKCLTEFFKLELTDTQPVADSAVMCMAMMKWLK